MPKFSKTDSCGSQEFHMPSPFGGGAVFTITDVVIVQGVDNDGKPIVVRGTTNPRGFVAFVTDLSDTEFLFVSAMLRSRTYFNAEDQLFSHTPKGSLVARVKELLFAAKPTTLEQAKNALLVLKGTKCTIKGTEAFRRYDDDDRLVPALCRDYDIVG